MSNRKTMNLLANALLVLLFAGALLAPATDAASISVSNSISNTPSFSPSLSISISGSPSVSSTGAISISPSPSLTFTASLLFSRSSAPSISATFGTSITQSPNVYRLQNRCEGQSTSVCPFWQPNICASYKMTLMNSSGSMYTYDNILVPTNEIPQYPLSFESTNGYIVPGSTYRIQLFCCALGGANCVENWTPLVVTTALRRKPACDPNFLCGVKPVLVGPQLTVSWVNSLVVPLKRAILKVTVCYAVNTFVRISIPNRRVITRRNPRPAPTQLTIVLPVQSLCRVQLVIRYHPKSPKNFIYRWDLFA